MEDIYKQSNYIPYFTYPQQNYAPLFAPLKVPTLLKYQMRPSNLSEQAYFIKNPNVAGMATEDNKVIFNPNWEKTATPQQKYGLYLIESARQHMKKDNSWKDVKLTPEQENYFKSMSGSEYSKLGDFTKQTLISRIIGGDKIPNAPYTEKQKEIANKIWLNMNK